MEGFFIKILDDYHACNKSTCEQCSANIKIDTGYDTTYCMFLREHGRYIYNEVLKAMEKST